MSQNVSPILIIWDSQTAARLSGYITEILHVEGYNWFAVHDLCSCKHYPRATCPISDRGAHPHCGSR